MVFEKLARGVLELETAIGPRYLQPRFFERALLIWTFRNFEMLPQQVLHGFERNLIDRLCSENRFVAPVSSRAGMAIIGRIERRGPATVEATLGRKPSESGVGKREREAASA
jgi:hypothetical protein